MSNEKQKIIMETGNNLVAAFTGHRKERMLQGGGNNPRLTGEIRNAVLHEVVKLYKKGYRVFYTGMLCKALHNIPYVH